eukprot:1031649-Prorocentrum_minimum.AAC.6
MEQETPENDVHTLNLYIELCLRITAIVVVLYPALGAHFAYCPSTLFKWLTYMLTHILSLSLWNKNP